MAIGWLSILKAVPWGEVVSNAPKVADGTKRLWETVARKKSPTGTSATATPEAPTLGGLEIRVSELAGDVGRLQQEMVDSTQLIKALADQNTQLIRRVYWLNRTLVAVGSVAVVSLALVLLR